MMPEYGMGYWQCKLRYRNQEELLAVAREHKRRGLPMDAIVVDFFHWTMQGEFKFEPRDWPDPDAMVKELKEMGIETVVSVWPTVDERCENYGEMADKGYLVRNDRGNACHMTWMGNTTFYDTTNPGARQFVWDKCKENYYKKESVFSGWMRLNRNMEPMNSITIVIMRDLHCSAPIFIR